MEDHSKQKFVSLDVEKLNIVDTKGNVKMTLFNNENIPACFMDGEDILPGHRQNDPISGMMFYNNEGDECGGLIFGNRKDEEGNYESSASLTFDQYKQDQVVQMHYVDTNGEKHYGFTIYDRPEETLSNLVRRTQEIENSNVSNEDKDSLLDEVWEGNTQRAFMGKNQKGEVSVKLMDSKGQERIRMVVDENDVPKMEFLDGEGNVVYRLPPEK